MTLDLSSFKALTFDVYGTLIDWEPSIISMFQSVADQYGVDLSHEQLLLEFDRARAQLQRVRPALLYPEVLRRAYDEFCERYDIPANDAERDVFANAVMLWPAFPDAREALSYLHGHFKIGLLSNIDDASLSFSTRKLGLTADVIATAESVAAYKPDHDHFFAAFESFADLGISKEQILHVGQSLRADVIPANALGIKVAWIKRPGRSLGSRAEDARGARPDMTFDTLEQLAALHRAQLSTTKA
ncbi:MAG TPA: HAD family hydrolase [Steroidobacteraceae bacterium]|nr:HAD family hydrolase [Steroidobacteraceae bacterium]